VPVPVPVLQNNFLRCFGFALIGAFCRPGGGGAGAVLRPNFFALPIPFAFDLPTMVVLLLRLLFLLLLLALLMTTALPLPISALWRRFTFLLFTLEDDDDAEAAAAAGLHGKLIRDRLLLPFWLPVIDDAAIDAGCCGFLTFGLITIFSIS